MSSVELLALTPLILVALTAIVLMMLAARCRNHHYLFYTYECGLLLALLALLLTRPADTGLDVTPLLRIDAFYHFFAPFFVLLSMVLGAMGAQYFDRIYRAQSPLGEFYVLLAVVLLGALVLAGAQNFAGFFIGVELIAVSSFALVAYPVGMARPLRIFQAHSLEAGFKYLVLSSVASAMLLMGIALLYLHSGSLGFVSLQAESASLLPLTGLALLLVGIAIKLSLAPFHLWTPDVYQGAPTPVTALIATLGKAGLVAVFMRYLVMSDILNYPAVLEVLAVLMVLSILAGNLLALKQDNIKRLLAYSSIAHLGYLLLAFITIGMAAGTDLALNAGAFYVVAYSVTTLGAFSLVNLISDSGEGDVSNYRLERFRGLFWSSPWLALCFSLILLSLAGIPLTVGFVGKFYLFVAGAEAGLWFLLLWVVVGSAVGLYYYLSIILLMAQRTEVIDSAGLHWNEHLLAYGITAFVLFMGLYPTPLIGWLPWL